MVDGPVLVVGAGGQVGGALVSALAERGVEAVGTWRDPPSHGLAADLEILAARPEEADRLLERAGAATLVVAAGMTHVDACEDQPERAAAANRDAPSALARAAARRGARTAVYSTDYVFDGRSGPYAEDDAVAPISVYGRTKLEGEEAVLAADPTAHVLRTAVVYGPEAQGKNFAYQVAGRLRRGEPVRAPEDQRSSPTYNRDLATATLELLDAGRPAAGVVNVAGPEVLGRATFARRLAAAMGFDPAVVGDVATADLGQRAPRPLGGGLQLDRLHALCPALALRDVEAAVAHWASVTTPPWAD